MSGVTFSGRTFTTPEIDLMREIARDYAGLGVTEIARTVCELLHWNRPSGGLKNHECRLLLEHLRNAGMLTLPAVRALGGRGPRKVRVTTGEAQAELITGAAGGFSSMQLRKLETRAEAGASMWSNITIWVVRYLMGRIYATGCGTKGGCWLACCGPRRRGG